MVYFFDPKQMLQVYPSDVVNLQSAYQSELIGLPQATNLLLQRASLFEKIIIIEVKYNEN